jgi:hypothetical protein
MYKLSTYLVVAYFVTYLYMLDLLLIEWVTKMKLGSNSVEFHPVVGAHSLWAFGPTQSFFPKYGY